MNPLMLAYVACTRWKGAEHDADFVQVGKDGMLRVRSVVRTNPLLQMDREEKKKRREGKFNN